MCTQSVLVDSLCYLLSSVSRDSALNKNRAVISQRSQNTTPRVCIGRTEWDCFFDVVVANCCFSMIWWWWKPFYVQTLNWVGSQNPQACIHGVWEWVMNVLLCCYVVVHIRPHHLGSDEIQDGGHVFSMPIIPNYPIINFFSDFPMHFTSHFRTKWIQRHVCSVIENDSSIPSHPIHSIYYIRKCVFSEFSLFT